MARKALVSTPSGLHATSVLPESADIRALDALVGAAISAGSVLWTASRPTLGSQLGWGTVWAAIGALAGVEGRGALLKYGGFSMMGGQTAYLALRLAHPNLAPAQQPTGYVQPAQVQAAQAAQAAHEVFPNGYMA